ncbi:preprotein translocase subunit SecG [Pedobacter sp. SL55]|uniref:preprotein translocase subunit SecG n=1 Tax=Pedobacter sp. SL55 TaxID=2995161 RepID=UPI00226D75DA|nr:preprotein translocase subunit SecG [Pedobacter sp. SL55]WAC42159.1 preprotein translocase subunit SecG [Pedobacter sp. SL55]
MATTLLIVLLVIACIALALFILIQNPKGGGLATGGASSNMFGVQRTGDVLEKGTWVLLALIVVFSLAITAMSKSSSATGATGSKIDELINKTAAPSPIGSGLPTKSTAPAATPAKADTTKK